MNTYSVFALAAAGILPPLAAVFMAWYCKRTLRRMDNRLAQMQELHGAMCEMVSAPARIRAMAKEMRDSVTRIQEMPIDVSKCPVCKARPVVYGYRECNQCYLEGKS